MFATFHDEEVLWVEGRSTELQIVKIGIAGLALRLIKGHFGTVKARRKRHDNPEFGGNCVI